MLIGVLSGNFYDTMECRPKLLMSAGTPMKGSLAESSMEGNSQRHLKLGLESDRGA